MTFHDTEPLDLEDVDWFVVTPENAEESFEKLKNQKLEIVFFAITEKGYEKLSINNQKMLKMLSDQKQLLWPTKSIMNRPKAILNPTTKITVARKK